ncbi:GIY-YIG nuclease family protein [Leptolyngbya sp. FACHB-671]|uniref:GIY-YIG nuclease family protein n=1 Tax=Leptolyngbya sp. FACHB-671 TaxID=2692812 RepID=UPI0016825278|nr:GIY-YIG nuclease family protein [Leptolyngbya sp. FACHB-671]MBD2067626.1 GIY-YIG nuclease family protein [Leptolyngbya sp. FACHB-671]
MSASLQVSLCAVIKSASAKAAMINPFQFAHLSYREKYLLPQESGIYYVLNLKTHSILYIGRARNIRKRWTSHHREVDVSCLAKVFGDYFISIAWELRPAQGLEKAESRRIRMFDPPFNNADEAASVKALIEECTKSGMIKICAILCSKGVREFL